MTASPNDLLSQHLSEQGLDAIEVQAVLKKLEEYDKKVIRESVFDSIERGSFSLDAIVAEAVSELSDLQTSSIGDESLAESVASTATQQQPR